MNSSLHDARGMRHLLAPLDERQGGVTDPGSVDSGHATDAELAEVHSEPTGLRDAGVGGCPPVLTVDELAALLRTNRKTIYESVRLGKIPGVRRMGRSIRIHRDTVLRWLAEGQGRVSRRRGAG